jgi:hypothetical protein
MSPAGEVLEAALRYAGRGWPVFPCRSRAKRPATEHGLHDATLDDGLISGWWEMWPDANVAIRTGRESCLVVVDVDGEEGRELLGSLQQRHEALPATATVTTPRGGTHLYFQHPGGTVPNSAGQLGRGLDVRGDGGYVLAPPSLVGDRPYEPARRAPVQPLPEWLGPLLTRDRPRQGATPPSVWTRMVRDGLPEGERNSGLARLVGHLLARDVNALLVAEFAHLVNGRCRPPLPAEDVDRVVASIAGRELRQRTKGQR